MIRKLFTGGLEATTVTASAWSATGAMLRSIWKTRTEMQQDSAPAPDEPKPVPIEKLLAQSLIIAPRPQTQSLSQLSDKRRALAA